jgi:hypothetical protein
MARTFRLSARGMIESHNPSLLPKPPQTGAGLAGGRQERTNRPVDEGAAHLKGRNGMEDPGAAGVAARRDGPTGQLRPPARLGPEAHASAHRALSARTGKARPPRQRSSRLCRRDAAGGSGGAQRNQSAVRLPEQGNRRRPARYSPTTPLPLKEFHKLRNPHRMARDGERYL